MRDPNAIERADASRQLQHASIYPDLAALDPDLAGLVFPTGGKRPAGTYPKRHMHPLERARMQSGDRPRRRPAPPVEGAKGAAKAPRVNVPARPPKPTLLYADPGDLARPRRAVTRLMGTPRRDPGADIVPFASRETAPYARPEPRPEPRLVREVAAPLDPPATTTPTSDVADTRPAGWDEDFDDYAAAVTRLRSRRRMTVLAVLSLAVLAWAAATAFGGGKLNAAAVPPVDEVGVASR